MEKYLTRSILVISALFKKIAISEEMSWPYRLYSLNSYLQNPHKKLGVIAQTSVIIECLHKTGSRWQNVQKFKVS